MHTIRVVPAEDWWVVRSDGIDNDLMFKSGARAETAAKRLAQALAASGEPVKLHIHARDGSVAGRFLCPPPPPTPRSERRERAPDLAAA